MMPTPPDESTQWVSGCSSDAASASIILEDLSKEGHDSSIELEFGRREEDQCGTNGLCTIEDL